MAPRDDVVAYLEASTGGLEVLRAVSDAMSGKTFHHHYHILHALRTLLGPQKAVYVEIGTFDGGSMSLMLRHAFPTDIICIDPLDHHPDQVQNVEANLQRFNPDAKKVSLMRKRSGDAGLLRELGERAPFVDILFVDGDHSQQGATQDFWNFYRTVKPGGFIVMDDYHDARDSPGVKPAVDAIVRAIHERGMPFDVIGTVSNASHGARPASFPLNNCFVFRRQHPPERPKFGVCISTYRRENGTSPSNVRRALASVAAQSYDNWRVYLVGDRYDDDVEFEGFAELLPRGKCVSKNLPVAAERDFLQRGERLWRIAGSNAFNEAMSMATEDGCDFVLHLDDDDWWAPARLERLAACARAFPEAIFMYNYSTYPGLKKLPREEVADVFYGNLAPRRGNMVHSTFCLHRRIAEGFRYATYDAENDARSLSLPCGDMQCIDFVNNYVANNPDASALFIPEVLTFKESEGESKA